MPNDYKAKLTKKGIKQQFIADKMNKSKGLISQWISGTKPVPTKHITQFEALLN